MELVYIGVHPSRFITGNKYSVISFFPNGLQTGEVSRYHIMDKDGILCEFSSDIIWNYFMTLSEYKIVSRNQKLESIGI